MFPLFFSEFVSLIASEAKDVGEHPHIKKDHVVEAIKVGKTRMPRQKLIHMSALCLEAGLSVTRGPE